MQLFLSTLSIVAAAAAALPLAEGDTAGAKWSAFKASYGRSYRSEAEASRRLAIFTENLAVIEAANRRAAGGAVYGVGPFADVAAEEFMQTHTSPSPPPPASMSAVYGPGYLGEHSARLGEAGGLPKSLDWVPRGAVSSVKDQKW